MSLYNTAIIRHAFTASRYTINALASRLGVSDSAIENMLRGHTDPGELRVQTLALMADLLGLPAAAMLAPNSGPRPTTAATAPDTEGDAHTVVALLYTEGSKPTAMTDLCVALGWNHARLRAALDLAGQRLTPAGLRVVRTHGEVAIVPLDDHTAETVALDDVRAHERGLHTGNYRLVHELLTGQPTTAGMAPRGRRVSLGGLINAGIATDARSPALTETAQEAFL